MGTGAKQKRCSECGEWKPHREFYKFSEEYAKDRGDANGLRSKCKECICQAARDYKRLNRKRLTAYMRAYRARKKAEAAAARKPRKRGNG